MVNRRAVDGVLDTTLRIQPARITNGPVTYSTRTYEVGKEEGREGGRVERFTRDSLVTDRMNQLIINNFY